ncbi:MAG: hypothetical protein JWR15_2706 [Prosthecobacter sp.]|nr:hypothetical protein [Prosthecobacter sp.]
MKTTSTPQRAGAPGTRHFLLPVLALAGVIGAVAGSFMGRTAAVSQPQMVLHTRSSQSRQASGAASSSRLPFTGEAGPAASLAHPNALKADFNASQCLQTIASAPASEAAFAAARQLAQAGPEVEAQIIAALSQAALPEHARALASALAMIGSADAIEAIWNHALKNSDPALRTALLGSFDHVTNPEGVSLIASALAVSDDSEVISAATRTLARAATADTVNVLAELYAQPARQPEQRAKILTAISAVTNPQAVTALGQLATQVQQPELAAAAAASLAKSATAESAIALSDAYLTLTGSDPETEALRQRLLETFATSHVTPDNAAYIATQSQLSISPAWQAAAQHLIASAAQSTSAAAVR